MSVLVSWFYACVEDSIWKIRHHYLLVKALTAGFAAREIIKFQLGNAYDFLVRI